MRQHGGGVYAIAFSNPVTWYDASGATPMGSCGGGCSSASSGAGQSAWIEMWPPPIRPCCPSPTTLAKLLARLRRNQEIQAQYCSSSPEPPGGPSPAPGGGGGSSGPIRTQCRSYQFGGVELWSEARTEVNLSAWNRLSGCIQACMVAWEDAVRGFCANNGGQYFATHLIEGECAGAKAEQPCLESSIREMQRQVSVGR